MGLKLSWPAGTLARKGVSCDLWFETHADERLLVITDVVACFCPLPTPTPNRQQHINLVAGPPLNGHHTLSIVQG